MATWYWFDVAVDRQVATNYAALLEEAASLVSETNRNLEGATRSAMRDFEGASAESLRRAADRTLSSGGQLHSDLLEAARQVDGQLADGLEEQSRRQALREADRLRELQAMRRQRTR